MTDAIAVVNAGSWGIKFSLFAEQDGKLELMARGQTEGIHTAPHFVAKDSAGAPLADKSWGDDVKLGHAGALDDLMGFVRSEFVFMGGIGENSRALREHVCNDAAWLGIELCTAANQANASRISTRASRVAAWVIPTNEELMIARHTQTLLSAPTRQRIAELGVDHVQ